MQLISDEAGSRTYTLVRIPCSGVPRMSGMMPEVWEQGLKNNFVSLTFLSPRLQGGSRYCQVLGFY